MCGWMFVFAFMAPQGGIRARIGKDTESQLYMHYRFDLKSGPVVKPGDLSLVSEIRTISMEGNQ